MALNPFQGVREAAGMKIVYWGKPQEREGSQVGKGWNVGTLPCSLQELEQVGRCRRLPIEGSELPRVSGAGAGAEAGAEAEAEAEAGAGRLASVSKAASSQEPEPGPGEGETKLNRKLTNQGPFSPNQYNVPPTHMPRHSAWAPVPSAPHHHWPLAPAPPLQLRAADRVSPPPRADPLQPQGECRGQTGRG